MMSSLFRKIALLSVVGFLTSSCGGGGGGGGVANGGISGTGIGVGEITGFGSIIINGRHYETTGARRIVDDVEQDPADDDKTVFKAGMVAVVLATNGGSGPEASLVVVEDVLKGLVTAVAPDGSSITVLGQTVVIPDPQKVLDQGIANPGALLNRDVEVYGLVREPGVVVASLIEDKGTPGSILQVYRVKGFVSPGSGTNSELMIGIGLKVDFSSCAPACIGDMPANPAQWDNLFVEAKGNPADFTPGSPAVLVVTKVEPEGLPQGVDLNDVDEAEIEGFITAIKPPLCDGNGKSIAGEFVLSGLATVMTTATTVYEGGLCEEAVVGAKVEVEGMAGSPLIAKKIEFKDPVKLEGDVASKVNNVLTLDGLPGISVTVNAQTIYKGAATSLADIDATAPDHVRIRGRATGATTVVATEVDDRGVRGLPAEVILQGAVDAVPAPADPTLSILGVSINTSGISDGNFQGLEDSVLGRVRFFNNVGPGDLVKAKGEWDGSSVTWDEIELQD